MFFLYLIQDLFFVISNFNKSFFVIICLVSCYLVLPSFFFAIIAVLLPTDGIFVQKHIIRIFICFCFNNSSKENAWVDIL